jgi:hypothetical protein
MDRQIIPLEWIDERAMDDGLRRACSRECRQRLREFMGKRGES